MALQRPRLRLKLYMPYSGGALPGFGVAAPAQAVSSATVVEAYLKGLYNLERERDTLPWILSRIYDRFSNRSLAASPDETPSELALRADVDVINAAYTDPRVQVALARTGDSDDPPGPDGPLRLLVRLRRKTLCSSSRAWPAVSAHPSSLVNFCGRRTSFASAVWPLRFIGPSCLRAAFLEQPCHMSWCR